MHAEKNKDADDSTEFLEAKIHEFSRRGENTGSENESAPNKPAEQAPKKCVSDNCDMGEAAKSIQSSVEGSKHYGRNNVFELLREKNIIYRDGNLQNMPRYKYIKQGLLDVEKITKTINGCAQKFSVTVVTPRGLLYIAELVENDIAEKKADARKQDGEGVTDATKRL